MTKVTHLTLDESGGLNKRRIHLREISGDSETPLGTVGQDLRAARLRLGDDLAVVSKTLKIRKDLLEAIEEDRFEALPGRAYAVGFVRSYADYLGLDAMECVERFKLEIAGRGEVDPIPTTASEHSDERGLPHGWIVIAVVVLGLFIFGAYHLATSADSLVNGPVAPVPAQIAPAKPHIAAKNPQPQSPFAVATTQAPANTTMPPAIDTQQPANTAANPAQPAVLQQGQVYGAQNKGARVVLRIRTATRILVQDADGKTYINRTLQPGDTYYVPLVDGVTLTTSNGAAVELDLDGQAMGAASKDSGTVEAMPLDPQSVADHGNAG